MFLPSSRPFLKAHSPPESSPGPGPGQGSSPTTPTLCILLLGGGLGVQGGPHLGGRVSGKVGNGRVLRATLAQPLPYQQLLRGLSEHWRMRTQPMPGRKRPQVSVLSLDAVFGNLQCDFWKGQYNGPPVACDDLQSAQQPTGKFIRSNRTSLYDGPRGAL